MADATISKRFGRVVWSLVLKLCRNLRRSKGKTLSRACVHPSPTIRKTVLFAFALLLRYNLGHPQIEFNPFKSTMVTTTAATMAANKEDHSPPLPLDTQRVDLLQQKVTETKPNEGNTEENSQTRQQHKTLASPTPLKQLAVAHRAKRTAKKTPQPVTQPPEINHQLPTVGATATATNNVTANTTSKSSWKKWTMIFIIGGDSYWQGGWNCILLPLLEISSPLPPFSNFEIDISRAVFLSLFLILFLR